MSEQVVLSAGLDVAKEFIPRRVRRLLYASTSIVGYLLLAVVAGFAAADVAIPKALVIALAVLGSLTGPIGQLAASNTTSNELPEREILEPPS